VQLLSTKLSIPPLRPRLVERPRLIQALNRGMDCGFVLISAPAGYGKSTLLSAWLNQLAFPSTWFSIDEEDNHPNRFLAYLTAALRKIEPSVDEFEDTALKSLPLPPMEVVLTPLINHLASVERRFCLVLDNYHEIKNQVVHQAMTFLLEHRPASLHLVIATRADPPLSLSRMRGRAQMAEIRLADLRFSAQEISAFLGKVMELNLSEKDLAFLETITEGWIAGLQMAGLSLLGREEVSAFIQSFSGEHRYILDFLFEEVFQRQSAELQNFLLQTAVLEQFSGNLCDAVTLQSNSQAILETLERSNLFLIALDEQRKWYRYHHLFSDLLKSRLKQTYPNLGALLYQRASSWYAEEHDLEKAITYALAAMDYERVASLVEQVAQNLDMQNEQAMLASWVGRLPADILEKHPWLCVYRAWGYYWTGRREVEEEWLQLAEKALEKTFDGKVSERDHILGHIAAIRAHTALVAENIPRALEMGEEALRLLPESDEMRFETAIALGGAYWALGDALQSEQAFGVARAAVSKARHTSIAVGPIGYGGIQQVKQGRLQDAMASFQDALRMATLSDGRETPVAGFPLVRLGDVWRERNDLPLASQYLFRGLEQCLRLSQPDVLTDAYVCFGRYQLAVGDLVGTRASLQKADQIAQQIKVDRWILCWLEDLRLRIWLAEGNLEAVNQWVENCGLSPDGKFSYQHDLHHQNLARALVAQAVSARRRSSYTIAASLLDRLRIAAEGAGWVHELIRIMVLQVINEQAFGTEEMALNHLTQALSLAQPGGYMRVFLDEGENLKRLLWQLDHDLEENSAASSAQLRLYLSELLAAYEHPASRLVPEQMTVMHTAAVKVEPTIRSTQSDLWVERLSKREVEVLKLLAQGYSDKRIAQTLQIARETVHKHLMNIYGKLEVHNRTTAVARARELGYL
jgi:LuxR family maltose regulon positive regulatory protein